MANITVNIRVGMPIARVGMPLWKPRGVVAHGKVVRPGRALDGLKFAECLPPDLAAAVVRDRLSDGLGVAEVLGRASRSIITS